MQGAVQLTAPMNSKVRHHRARPQPGPTVAEGEQMAVPCSQFTSVRIQHSETAKCSKVTLADTSRPLYGSRLGPDLDAVPFAELYNNNKRLDELYLATCAAVITRTSPCALACNQDRQTPLLPMSLHQALMPPIGCNAGAPRRETCRALASMHAKQPDAASNRVSGTISGHGAAPPGG